MRLIPPPHVETGQIPTREYRVTFWQRQLPDPGDGFTPEQMGWSAYHVDIGDAEDVHEVIAWAEDHFEEHTRPGSERGYVLCAWVPGETWLLQIAGWDPTTNPDAGREYNLHRRHPLPRS